MSEVIQPLPYAVDGVCNDEPRCPWFKGDLDAPEGEHCRITKASVKKKPGNCRANELKDRFVN